MNDNFCAFILSHGRADNVITYRTLRKQGYTGKIYIIIDDEDSQADKYYENYPGEVIMFSKADYEGKIDKMDNFGNRKVIVYARNACWDIAEKLGIEYFIQLDDDYTEIQCKVNERLEYKYSLPNIDSIFDVLLKYYKNINVLSVAMAQCGDYIGGIKGGGGDIIRKQPKRKCMNSFICCTKNRFWFRGTMNEDVNTYIELGGRGGVFLTIPYLAVNQTASQKGRGGMTDIYLGSGTYRKSYYTVMCAPSCARVAVLHDRYSRLHHLISWNNAVPCIIREGHKKSGYDL